MLHRSAPATPTSRGDRSARRSPRVQTTPSRRENDLRVVVRVRPAEGTAACVTVHGDGRSLSVRLPSAPGPLGKSRSYTFDQAFDQATTQAEIFAAVGAPLVESVLEGFNATIFAYGQTGSGKTYTMHGDEAPSSHGLMLRAVEALYAGMERSAATVTACRAEVTYAPPLSPPNLSLASFPLLLMTARVRDECLDD